MQFIYNLSQQNKIYLNNLTIQKNENKHFSMAKDTNKKNRHFFLLSIKIYYHQIALSFNRITFLFYYLFSFYFPKIYKYF